MTLPGLEHGILMIVRVVLMKIMILLPIPEKFSLEKTNPDEVRVISRVTWSSGNQRAIQTAEVETYLYNVYGS